MTDLQLAIINLKDGITEADLVLQKLEAKQKDLEKPPPHKWVHGDVFMNTENCQMIFISCAGEDMVFCLGVCTGHDNVRTWTKGAKFLFNIREKL